MPPVLLDTADLQSVMTNAVNISKWSEEECKRLDRVATTLSQPDTAVSPAMVLDLIAVTQKSARWSAAHALLTAQVLVGGAEKAERAAPKRKRKRDRLAAWLLR